MTEEIQELHAVIYTDGGFKPSHVIGGWGFHGYVFTQQECKTGTGAKNFTPGPKGYLKGNVLPVPITVHEYVNGLGSITENATNNVAELMGATRALKYVLGRGLKTVHLLLDSQYVLKGLTEYIGRWESAGWVKGDGQPVANLELWQELLAVKRAVEAAGVEISMAWVRGHNKEWSEKTEGEPGNAAADELCNRACQAAINGVVIDQVSSTPAKGYWKVKADRNRMLNLRSMLYIGQLVPSTDTESKPSVYMMTQFKAQNEFLRMMLEGKPMSDSQFAVVELNEPDPVIKTLTDLHDAFAVKTSLTPIVRLDLATITKPEVYHSINTTGADYLIHSEREHRVMLLDKTPLSVAMEPPRLAMRALTTLEAMYQILQRYRNPVAEEVMIQFTDITELLYGMVEKGKKSHRKLKDHVTSTTRTLSVEVGYRTDVAVEVAMKEVSLSLTLDLPDRNTLSALAESVVKVVAVTWPESKRAIRCATIIETIDGCGIWATPHANLHFVS